MPQKPTLAIISTYGSLCGIAGYTHWLEKQLDQDFDISIFPLDQNLLRRTSKNGIKIGDGHIEEIASELKRFDYINLQFEPGTLGPDLYRAVKRFETLLSASPNMTITFHTVVREQAPGWVERLKPMLRGHLKDALAALRPNVSLSLWNRVYRKVKEASEKKSISAIVHTKRESDFLRIEHNITHVYDHPLSFLKEEDAVSLRKNASRDEFPVLNNLDSGAKLIGVFGFIAPYKGIQTAIRALTYLPEDYHLLVFGGIHPNEIKEDVSIFPYLEQVQEEIEEEFLSENVYINEIKSIRNKKPITDSRIHFMGAVDDPEFLKGMALCDYVVFPYEEVGQSASGPITMALEMECPALISRNLMSKQLARYYPEHFTEFDIGAHLQLAQYIHLNNVIVPGTRNYNWKTNRKTYLEAIQH